MTVRSFIDILDEEQSLVIKGDIIGTGFMRTVAGDVPITLLSRRVKIAYPQNNNEIVIELANGK